MMRYRIFAAALALPFATIATAASAQEQSPASAPSKPDEPAAEEDSGPFDIDAEVSLNSDYRFRGISLSGHDAEVTGEVSVSHESGFYGTAWISNVDLDDGKADELEVDLSAGWSKDLGNINVDAGAVYYLYPKNGDFNYVELYASAAYLIGDGEIRAGFAYAPSQDNIGNQSNRYYYISGEMPIAKTPLSVHGSFGIEDGAFADRKKDWLVGVSVDAGHGITATFDYVDTARAFSSLGRATLVGRVAFSF